MKIDLGSEVGNAFELIGIAVGAARQMCMTEGQIEVLVKRMTAGSYSDLLDVMDDVFPYCFQFVGDPRLPVTTRQGVGADFTRTA